MTRAKSHATMAREPRLQEAINGINSGHFTSAHDAAKQMPDVRRSTLYDRLNGAQPQNQAHEDQQILTYAEERELAEWVSYMTHLNHAPSYSMIRHMAENLLSRRVRNINDEFIEYVRYESIGEQRLIRFKRRHPYLQTIMPRLIEAARVKEMSYETLKHYFVTIQAIIEEHNIQTENIYNMDESGFAIGAIEASKVVIDTCITQASTYCQAQPGRQEWVTAVECICADGSFIPPCIIFKAENFCHNWVPVNTPKDWAISNNSQGWTSNQYGADWLQQCFEPLTREKANGRWRLLICDGYNSHISADWLTHCLENKIIPALLVPHSSHLTQPLDIGIFGPLKKVLSRKLAPLLLTQVRQIQKPEWLSVFIEAHHSVFNPRNIRNSFSGAGLVPFNPEKVLHRVLPLTPPPVLNFHSTLPTTPTTPFSNAILTSSPLDGNATHKANAAVIELMASGGPLDTPTRNYITCMTRRNNRLQARTAILEQRVEEATKVLSGRKERTSGKRHSIKGKNIMTVKELELVMEAELATKQRKRKRSNTETLSGNNVTGPSSNTVASINSAPAPVFVEGGVIISFEDNGN